VPQIVEANDANAGSPARALKSIANRRSIHRVTRYRVREYKLGVV